MSESKENKALYNYLKSEEFIKYVTNHLKKEISDNSKVKGIRNKYTRYIFIIIKLSLLVYLTINKEKQDIILTTFDMNFPVVYMLWPIFILTIYLGVNAYKPKEKIEDDYEHKKKFNRLCWIIAVYIVWWLLIIKSNWILIEDGVIWEMLKIKIVYYYDFAQQREFFFKYLDILINDVFNFSIEEKMHLNYL